MNAPWIILTLLAILAFAVFEARAFRHPERQNTLSRSIWLLGENWPLSIFLMGMFAGGLAVHFFWHWCPDLGVGTGFLSPPAVVSCRPGPPGSHALECPALGYMTTTNDLVWRIK